VNSVLLDENADWNNTQWVFQPLVLRETLQLGDNASISEELRFNFEEYKINGSGLLYKSLTSLNLGDFSASFTMDYMYAQEFVGEYWQDNLSSNQVLRPSFITMSYSLAGRERLYWKNRIRVGTILNTSWSMNIEQCTENSLDLSLTFDFWLYRFLKLSLTTSSYNNRTYQYFPALAAKLGQSPVDPIRDLLYSFDFFSKNSRQHREQSAFNLRSITLEAVHYLHDWNLTLSYEGKPVLDEGAMQYQWRSSFSILLQWLPIPEIRSNPKSQWNQSINDYEFSLRG
jgi:hypothetical protein